MFQMEGGGAAATKDLAENEQLRYLQICKPRERSGGQRWAALSLAKGQGTQKPSEQGSCDENFIKNGWLTLAVGCQRAGGSRGWSRVVGFEGSPAEPSCWPLKHGNSLEPLSSLAPPPALDNHLTPPSTLLLSHIRPTVRARLGLNRNGALGGCPSG